MIGMQGSAMEVEEDILLDDEPETMEPDHSAEHTDAIHPDMVSIALFPILVLYVLMNIV